MRNVRIFACKTYGYLHAKRTDIHMRNVRESYVERTRIACTGLGHEHVPRDVIENYLTAISLISDYISNQLFDIRTLP